MKFRTELNKYQRQPLIDYSKKVLCIGSCFAENLHSFLNHRKYASFLNPCGITYNPLSIAKSIRYLLGQEELKVEDISERDGIFFHLDFHSGFSATTKEGAYEKITNHLESARAFSDADVLILSLGTAYTYFLIEGGNAVNNCHKLASSNFEKKRLDVQESVDALEEAINRLRLANPSVEVIVTVSPVRHLRDGMVENNLSKSVLLLASRALTDCTYFPSYELLLDDLRDYRFYDRDLVHPSIEAIDYILTFFEGQFLSKKDEELRKKIVQVKKDMAHRPLFGNSLQHRQFLEKLIHRVERLEGDHKIDFKEELDVIKAQLR